MSLHGGLARHLRRVLERKRELECSPSTGYALGPRSPAVQANDRATNREPKPDIGAATFDCTAAELREYALELGIGHTAAVVLDADNDVRVTPLRTHSYDGAGRRVPSTVFE